MKKFLTTFFVIAFCYTNIEAQKTFDLDDLKKLVTLTDPQIAPDGKSVLIVVSRQNIEENKNKTEINLVDISTGITRNLTYNRISVGHPRWSPTGDRIAFIAKDGTGKDAFSQLFVMPMNGGDAIKITNSTTGIQQFAWKPDGNEIAFVQEDEPENKKEIEKGYDAFEVKYNSMFLSTKPVPSHIWLIAANGGTAKRLTSGSWSLPSSYPPATPASPLSWSPDGKLLLFLQNSTPYSGELFQSIQMLEVATGKLKSVTGRKTENRNALLESFPAFSPDGKKISYWFPTDGYANGIDVFVTSTDGGVGESISSKLDRIIYRSEWSSDSKSILVAANDGNSVSIWLQAINGISKKIELGNLCITGAYWYHCNIGKTGAIAIIASTTDTPQELYYLESPDTSPKKITSYNKPTLCNRINNISRNN